MKIAVLSDAHGNLCGLRRCLESALAAKPGELVFLGDFFGYGDEGLACLALLRSQRARLLMGNHEAMLLGALPLDEQRNRMYHLPGLCALPGETVAFLRALPASLELAAGGRRLLFVHGRPEQPLDGYLYPDGSAEGLGALPYDAAFMGHTHRPFVKTQGQTLLVNAGTCGLPRLKGNRLSYALYDTALNSCQIVSLPLEREDVVRCFAGAEETVKEYIEKHWEDQN